MKKKVILIFGMPGAGKGTFCDYFSKKNNSYIHLSVGDLLRSLSNGDSDEAQKFRETIFSDAEMYQLLRKHIDETCDSHTVLFDGFPRNLKQLDFLLNDESIEIVSSIYLRCPEDICLGRVLTRKHDRVDDSLEIFLARAVSFQEKTIPVINFLKENQSIFEVDSSQPVADICSELNSDTTVLPVVAEQPQNSFIYNKNNYGVFFSHSKEKIMNDIAVMTSEKKSSVGDKGLRNT